MAGPRRALEEQPLHGSKGAFSILSAEIARPAGSLRVAGLTVTARR
jgi:hypothetical protein